MRRILWALMIVLCGVFMSCSSSRKNFNPNKKIPRAELQKDFSLLRNILEEKHPSLYWYTPKDSINYYFNSFYGAIADSMTEQQFAWKILAPMIDKIHCGHTSIGMSKDYGKWASGRRQATFPLYMKIWNDTMAVTANLNRKDSIFKRGTLITSVNGIKNKELISDMFNYLPEDGQANNVNYIRLSANFPYYHRSIYGISKKYAVTYIDSNGVEKKDSLALHTIPRDSARKDSIVKREKIKLPKEKKQNAYRSLNIDSSGKFAVMTLNSFTKGRLRNFFRKSFRQLREKNISNLVLDIRSNGGGRVGLSTLLTKYISRQPFKVADTLFSVTQNLRPYTKYFEGGFLNNIELFFISHKTQDGKFHIRHLENKLYDPKKTAYKGEVYVLTNGPTFSAAALFANAVKGQSGIILLGEETGGGWHGNNGIMIPDVTLPNSKLRVRMPLFRLVQYNHVPQNGLGIVPDIYVGTSYEALIKGEDKKMEVVKEMILKKSEPAVANPVL